MTRRIRTAEQCRRRSMSPRWLMPSCHANASPMLRRRTEATEAGAPPWRRWCGLLRRSSTLPRYACQACSWPETMALGIRPEVRRPATRGSRSPIAVSDLRQLHTAARQFLSEPWEALDAHSRKRVRGDRSPSWKLTGGLAWVKTDAAISDSRAAVTVICEKCCSPGSMPLERPSTQRDSAPTSTSCSCDWAAKSFSRSVEAVAASATARSSRVTSLGGMDPRISSAVWHTAGKIRWS
mmetsp:Transcript_24974/g.69665  ORF Transcript_24974/g.69665 Transcript_24974/m.69665 type:complete len:238 (+) Transcript_24974:572-1285(+)